MTDEPLPFDLKLAREAFTTSAQLHGAATRRAAGKLSDDDLDRLGAHDEAFTAALRAGRVQDAISADGETAAELVEASFSSAGEELAAVVERGAR